MPKQRPDPALFVGKVLPEHGDYTIVRPLDKGLNASVFVAHSDSLASPRGRKRYVGRSQIDPRGFTFAKVEVLKFIALDDDERYRKTLLEWELPRCCHCPFHCPPHGQAQQEHPYAARFRTRWWNR